MNGPLDNGRMDIPPKGSLARQYAELGVRWRQMGRALAKEVPLIGLLGTSVAGWPVIRDLYSSPKTVARSDRLMGRKHPTLMYRIVNVLSYLYLVGGLVLIALIFLGVIR